MIGIYQFSWILLPLIWACARFAFSFTLNSRTSGGHTPPQGWRPWVLTRGSSSDLGSLQGFMCIFSFWMCALLKGLSAPLSDDKKPTCRDWLASYHNHMWSSLCIKSLIYYTLASRGSASVVKLMQRILNHTMSQALSCQDSRYSQPGQTDQWNREPGSRHTILIVWFLAKRLT